MALYPIHYPLTESSILAGLTINSSLSVRCDMQRDLDIWRDRLRSRRELEGKQLWLLEGRCRYEKLKAGSSGHLAGYHISLAG